MSGYYHSWATTASLETLSKLLPIHRHARHILTASLNNPQKSFIPTYAMSNKLSLPFTSSDLNVAYVSHNHSSCCRTISLGRKERQKN